MKRLFWPVCVVLVAIIVFSGFGGAGSDGQAQDSFSVSEAAFAVRTSGSEDVTSFLVGRFQGDQGTSLRFDGVGGVWETGSNLVSREGSVTLSQSGNGATLLQLRFDGVSLLYTFRLESAAGDFSLTDVSGNCELFAPQPMD